MNPYMKDFLIKGRRLDGEMDRRAIYVLKITNSYDFTSIAMDVHMHQGHKDIMTPIEAMK